MATLEDALTALRGTLSDGSRPAPRGESPASFSDALSRISETLNPPSPSREETAPRNIRRLKAQANVERLREEAEREALKSAMLPPGADFLADTAKGTLRDIEAAIARSGAGVAQATALASGGPEMAQRLAEGGKAGAEMLGRPEFVPTEQVPLSQVAKEKGVLEAVREAGMRGAELLNPAMLVSPQAGYMAEIRQKIEEGEAPSRASVGAAKELVSGLVHGLDPRVNPAGTLLAAAGLKGGFDVAAGKLAPKIAEAKSALKMETGLERPYWMEGETLEPPVLAEAIATQQALGGKPATNLPERLGVSSSEPPSVVPTGAKLTTDIPAYADVGGYARRPTASTGTEPLPLPEIAELATKLNEGKAPRIFQRLGGVLGRARFRGGEIATGGTADIELRADIFLGPVLEREAVSPAKLAERLPVWKEEIAGLYPNLVENGSLVTRQAYNRRTGRIELVAYERDPTYSRKILSHEIGHLVDWLPEGELKRGNILGRIATLKKYLRHTLDELKLEPVRDELKALAQEWKPFDTKANPKFTKYRHSGPELYADAFSVLLNEPALLERVAPTYRRALFDYMGRKPEVQALYEEIQNRLAHPEEARAARLESAREMLTPKPRPQPTRPEEGVSDAIMRGFIDRYHDLLGPIRKMEAAGGEKAKVARHARYKIEEIPYVPAEASLYLHDQNAVVRAVGSAGVDLTDLGVALFGKRVVGERGPKGVANPRGFDVATATELLEDLKADLGPEATKALQAADAQFRANREHVIERVIGSGLASPELAKVMRDARAYATFSVTKFLDDRVGSGTSAKIFRQIGTLSDIENPLIATAVKDVSLLRAAVINEAKVAQIPVLQEYGLIAPAKRRWSRDASALVPLPPKDPHQSVFTVMVDGKARHFYAHNVIVDSFRFDPARSSAIARLWGQISQPFRDILVSKNPGWMLRNIVRDIKQTVVNLPEVPLRKSPEFVATWVKSLPEVRRYVRGKEISPDIREMLEGRMIATHRQWSARDYLPEHELERLVTEFGVSDEALQRQRGKLSGVWYAAMRALDRAGRYGELTTKAAGYKTLKRAGTRGSEEISHLVRSRVGTPDFYRRGALNAFTNNVFMFSNIGKEGIRSSIESMREAPGAYLWKRAVMNLGPKLALLAAEQWGNDELKRMIGNISEYNRAYKTVVPLFMTESGKTVAVIVPEDHEGQIISAVMYKAIKGKIGGVGGVAATLTANQPYSPHPLVQAAWDAFQYYGMGINPTDMFFGRQVIPRRAYEAAAEAPAEANKAMLKHTYETLGGRTIYQPSYREFTVPDSALDHIMRSFPLNALRSFIVVTDQGLEQGLAEKGAEVRTKHAATTLELNKMIADGIKAGSKGEELWREAVDKGAIQGDVATKRTFGQRYTRLKLLSLGDPIVSSILHSTSNEEIQAKVDELKKRLPPEQYYATFTRLREAGVIK